MRDTPKKEQRRGTICRVGEEVADVSEVRGLNELTFLFILHPEGLLV